MTKQLLVICHSFLLLLEHALLRGYVQSVHEVAADILSAELLLHVVHNRDNPINFVVKNFALVQIVESNTYGRGLCILEDWYWPYRSRCSRIA